MILTLFVISVYVTYMQILKHDIEQLDHLLILVLFLAILLILATCEEHIIKIQKLIDNKIGWGVSQEEDNNPSLNINVCDYITCYWPTIKGWIEEDYKSSQCRKWIKWINKNARRIFSS
jgi:hypothetical protein